MVAYRVAQDGSIRLESGEQLKPDAVWFFDHDFVELRQVASSFNDWMRAYCQISN